MIPLNENSQVSQDAKTTEGRLKTSIHADNENISSGIESTVEYSTNESEPPQKLYITENENGEKVVHGRRSPNKNKEFVHKMRSSPKTPAQLFRSAEPAEKGGSGSDSSDVTGVPKSS